MSRGDGAPSATSRRVPGHTPVPRYRSWSGSAVLSQGFRPFFMLAGIWAAGALIVWLHALFGLVELPSVFDPLAWHVHEMLFGFVVATLAGFLLTALPNWTGRLPLQGWPLAGLVALWLAGRAAMAGSAAIGAGPAAAIDLAFLATLLVVALREIGAGRNWRNLPLALALAGLIAANALMHAGAAGLADTGAAGWRLGLSIMAALIGLIGGRIVPSFTRNWLAKAGESRLPAPFGRFDKACLALAVAALAAWTAFPDHGATAAACTLAALLHAVRLARWRGWRTAREPLLVILHVGYAWLPVSLALIGASAAFPAAVPASAGVHALTAGTIGTMTLAVMTRAILGHTGQALTAGWATAAIYLAVTLAALARVGAAFLADQYQNLLIASGTLWVLAFAGFVLVYARHLLAPVPKRGA